MVEEPGFVEQSEQQEKLIIRSTEDGLHLEGSILWFDSQKSGELSFLSAAPSIRTAPGPQVIATEETIRILETTSKKPKALVCQYNRPFSIGRLKMELLPSGSVLGGALLYVETGDRRLLYAPHLQTRRNTTVRKMQLKRAHTLILCADHPDPMATMPNSRKEKERLLRTIHHHVERGVWPVILCDPNGTAQEITKLLSSENLGVAVHNQIFRINRIYENYGSPLGRYARSGRKRGRRRVLLYPLSHGRRPGRLPLPEGPVLTIEGFPGESRDTGDAFRTVDDRFFISSSCDGKEIREVITAVAPDEVCIFGPYTKRYVEALKSSHQNIRALYPNDQPALF